jgi:hypothetical protein
MELTLGYTLDTPNPSRAAPDWYQSNASAPIQGCRIVINLSSFIHSDVMTD